jgi:alpha-tubulin suppressor-like RCC1 family protein
MSDQGSSWGSSGSIVQRNPDGGGLVERGERLAAELGLLEDLDASAGHSRVAIACGAKHDAVVAADGTLWTWGVNDQGQLGTGDLTDRRTPVQIGKDTDWAGVCAGMLHTLAIKRDGTLWAWGTNGACQLGLGDRTTRVVPTQVGADPDWACVTTGVQHTVAVKRDGSLWSWGSNVDDPRMGGGQLGLGDLGASEVPMRVRGASDWLQVAAGLVHSVALKRDGSLWAWGSGGGAQLGLGDMTPRTEPSRVLGAGRWIAAGAGAMHSVGLTDDGALWSWGTNQSGLLGLGLFDQGAMYEPVLVDQTRRWLGLGVGTLHTLAVAEDGGLWAWGSNSHGQLGVGDLDDSCEPTQVGNHRNWAKVAGGMYHSAAVKEDGSVWTWGQLSSQWEPSVTPRFLWAGAGG